MAQHHSTVLLQLAVSKVATTLQAQKAPEAAEALVAVDMAVIPSFPIAKLAMVGLMAKTVATVNWVLQVVEVKVRPQKHLGIQMAVCLLVAVAVAQRSCLVRVAWVEAETVVVLVCRLCLESLTQAVVVEVA